MESGNSHEKPTDAEDDIRTAKIVGRIFWGGLTVSALVAGAFLIATRANLEKVESASGQLQHKIEKQIIFRPN